MKKIKSSINTLEQRRHYAAWYKLLMFRPVNAMVLGTLDHSSSADAGAADHIRKRYGRKETQTGCIGH